SVTREATSRAGEMPVCERFSCKPGTVRTRANAPLIGLHAISPMRQRLSLEPIDEEKGRHPEVAAAPHNTNRVSSRGWRSAPRDLTPAQALARYSRRVLRFRGDGPFCDLIAAGGPSPSPRLGMTHIHSC